MWPGTANSGGRRSPQAFAGTPNNTREPARSGKKKPQPRTVGVSLLVVAVDPGSIPCKCSPASTRYAPAEGCGKVLTPTPSPSPSAIFRIFLFLSFTPEQGRFTGMATSNKLRVARDEKHNIAER